MQWTDHVGHRVRLCDLRVLLAVAHSGSISRAAQHLAISHPVVSRTISDLEHTLGVRLFDRTSRGVEPTIYGRGFLDCGVGIPAHASTRHPYESVGIQLVDKFLYRDLRTRGRPPTDFATSRARMGLLADRLI